MTSSAHRGNATDAELVRFFADTRDDGAFAELARRHGPMVGAVCRRVLSNAPEADDAAQATLLVLARKAASLRDPNRLGPWLHGVATRCALRARGRLAQRRSREVPMPDSLAAAEVAPTSPDWAPVLDAELARLPESFRTPLVLCEVEGLTRSEASARLGIPEGTLASRLARGKAKLQRRLVRRGVTLGAAGVGAVLGEAKASAAPALTSQVPGAGLSSAPAISMATQEILAMLSSMLAKLLLPLLLAAGVVTGLYFASDPPAAPAPPAQPEPTEEAKAKAERDEDIKGEREKFAGEWTIVSAKSRGKDVEGQRKTELIGKSVTFAGDRMTFRGPAAGYYLLLDATKHITVNSTYDNPGRAPAFSGIYDFVGTKLKMHIADDPPARGSGPVISSVPRDFESKPDHSKRWLLLVLERAKK